MNREQLAHVLRAAATITRDGDIVVIGSQSILGTFGDNELPGKAHCLEPHDLVVSKLVAYRQKDIEFATALIEAGLVETKVLLARANELEQPGAVIRRVLEAIRRCARLAEATP